MPDRLVIPAAHLETIRDHLLQADGQERMAYVSCTRSGDRFLVAEVTVVPDEAMRTQRRTACRPALGYERDQLQTCLHREYEPIILHSHPFSDTAGFSSLDVAAMDRYRDWLHGLAPDVAFGFGVLGRHDLTATVFDPASAQFHDLAIEVPGDWRLDTPVATAEETTPIDVDLYDRSLPLLTAAGQRRIAAATVAVVGTGGLGFILAKELVRLGVQNLVLVDPDHVERSNLNRLLGVSTWDVGRPKVTVLAEHLHDTGLDVAVEAVPERIEDATDHLAGCDVVFGTVDRVTTRAFLNQYAVQHLTYYIDAGTVIRTDDDRVTAIEGIVQLVAPGANACYACLDRVDPERARRERLSDEEVAAELEAGYLDASDLAPEPAVVTLNGSIASQAAAVFARLGAGYAAPPDMVRYEELAADMYDLSTRRDPACPTCGPDGLLAQGDRDPGAGAGEPAETDLDLHLPASPVEADGGTAPDPASDDRDRSIGSRLWHRLRRRLP